MQAKQEPHLLRKVDRWLRRHEIGLGSCVVAVSGGPDSVALLRALLALRPPGPEQSIIIAHLNHQLRGNESEADAAFVHDLHKSLTAMHSGLEFRCGTADVAASARAEHANLEGVARRLRYDWLVRVARDAGARWIATGHTADDQAETVLHRLLRGAGLQGLRGIAARRVVALGVEVVRPLLEVTRAEVLEYLDAEGQVYREDSSNRDMWFTRNRIRQQLLPHLARRYNPAIAGVLCRLAQQAEVAYRDIAAQAQTLLVKAELPRAGPLLIFDHQKLTDVPLRLVCEMFRLVWVREGWPTGRMNFAAWERVAGVALGRAADVDLPGGLQVRRKERVVQLGPRL